MSFKSNFPIIAAVAALAMPIGAFADSHVTADADSNVTADTVIATVNGTEIKLGHMIVLKQRLPQQYQQLDPTVLFDGILDQLVQQTLLGASVDTLSTGSQMTLDNEARALRAAEEIQRIANDATSDEALQAAYDKEYGDAGPEVEFNASHILVETEDEAKVLITELEGGADFAELAKEKSTGPSGPRGGELGWFGLGAMVQPFEEAVATMDDGQISAPVQTQFGWHVIKLNETRVKDAPTLDDVRGELIENVRRAAIESHVEELTGGAEITRKTVEEIDPMLINDLSLLEN